MHQRSDLGHFSFEKLIEFTWEVHVQAERLLDELISAVATSWERMDAKYFYQIEAQTNNLFGRLGEATVARKTDIPD